MAADKGVGMVADRMAGLVVGQTHLVAVACPEGARRRLVEVGNLVVEDNQVAVDNCQAVLR